jgi:carboxymethylenebutenolidase
MVSRRTIVQGMATMPLGAVLADPRLARAQADRLDEVTTTLPGGDSVTASIAMPETTPAPALILIHEWWGLNDQIKSVAADFAGQGYVALAVDLYGGEVATTPQRARQLSSTVDGERATQTLTTWAEWLRNHQATTGRLGTIGWCFGGGWSLNASIATPVDATVIYYGRVNKSPEEVANLDGPVLGHFGTQDDFINEDMVSTFTESMNEAAKSYTIHWYDADHAFANPTGGAYDRGDAELARQRTLLFFDRHLRG